MRLFTRDTVWISALLLALCATTVGAQSDAVSSPARRLTEWAAQEGGEKAYLHLNRTDLLCGEVMWFTFFSVNAMDHRPSRISQVGYVEVLDRKGTSVLQTAVYLNDGTGTGSVYLPATLPADHYTVRAYTAWMKDRADTAPFVQPITILNTLKSVARIPSGRPSAQVPRLGLFPEGGHLVSGLPSTVAVHAVGPDGKGVSIRGFVIRNAHDTVAHFSTVRHGLGNFSITPVAGGAYRVVAVDARGRSIPAQMPEVRSTGWVMEVKDTLEKHVRIRVRTNTGEDRGKFVVHTRHQVRYARSFRLRNGEGEWTLHRDSLDAGISHITVFDEYDRPLTERLVFNGAKSYRADVVPGQSVYSIRSRARLTLDAPEPGHYSVSVFRADSLARYSGMAEHLLLTSDLRGGVESPEFYFSGHPQAAGLADVLMLTHGWRRFRWEDVRDRIHKASREIPELHGRLIDARLLDSAGNPAIGRQAFLSAPGKQVRLYVARSDSSGKVRFDLRRHILGNRLIIQPDLRFDSLLRIEPLSPFTTGRDVTTPPDLRLDPALKEALVKRSMAVQVSDIYREEETYFNYRKIRNDTIPFYGKADEVYELDDYTRFPAMEEVLREYVKGVWVRRKGDRFRLRVVDRPRNEVFDDNPLILVDGVPYPDVDRLMEIDPLRIRRIEVVGRQFFLGPLRCSGIVSLTSYAADMGGAKPDPRAVVLDFEGLERQREFSAPAYVTPQERAVRLPDARYQLWFGQVSVQAAGKVEVPFTTSDTEGGFIISVEGLSRTGTPVSGSAGFRVER